MYLIDKLGMKDTQKTIRGKVSLYDNATKQYIFKEKENLIMNTGREYIKQLFTLNSGLLGINTMAQFTRQLAPIFNLSACVFGTDTNMSRYDMIYVPENYIQDYNILVNSTEFIVDYNSDMMLNFTITLNGLSTKQTMISNLALVLTTGGDKNQVTSLLSSGDTINTGLFSRLLFDPMPVGAGTSHTITYGIYF